jgi:pseudoazurin
MISFKKTLATGAAACLFASAAIQAKTIEVKGLGVAFEPSVIQADVGDTIHFTNMTGHFVDIVNGLWPEGAPKMHSEFGADYTYQVTTEGLYVFQCPPHWGNRMGAVMLVGKPVDLPDTIDKYIARAEADNAAKPAKSLLGKFKKQISE